ncbi:MAG: hypothetical protein JWM69_967 [Candidatus Binatus sp.]|nr:hypothetical protein [Candidatus Binatus sp.]
MKALKPVPLRHSFAIKPLERLSGLFPPRRYLYYCIRCKWSFLINDGKRGVLTALGNDGVPLTRDEARRRCETFALGPCMSSRMTAMPPGPSVQATSNGTVAVEIAVVSTATHPRAEEPPQSVKPIRFGHGV